MALKDANKPAGINFFETKNFFPITKPSIPETENPRMFPFALLFSEDFDMSRAENMSRPPNIDPAVRLALLPLATNPTNPPANVSPPTAVLRTIPLGGDGITSP